MLESLSSALIANPTLTLFLVIGIGYLLGEINFWGFRFGVAGVLFAGIAVGALSPDIHIPEAVANLGLILFVYTLGIQAGPAFFKSFREQGARQIALAITVLCVGFAVTLPLVRIFHVPGPRAAGFFTGALTSTPALAAVRDRVREQNAALPFDQIQKLANEPVLGYGITYPLGVIGVLLLFQVSRRLWKVDLSTRRQRPDIRVRDFTVENPAVVGRSMAEITEIHPQVGFVLSRIQKKGRTELPKEDTVLARGDVVAAVGDEEGLRRAEMIFGARAEEHHIEQDRSELDFRRYLVSSKDVVGKRVADLDLANQLGATVTRIRRGDAELVPTQETRLEFGDSVRVVSKAEQFGAISKFFGDSIRGSAETQFGSVAIGLVLGALVGMLPIPLPNGQVLRLGLAGGPLLVALILGRMERTARITWIMPVSANLSLRQVGSVLFLAGVGTNAGFGFLETFRSHGLNLLIAGLGLTLLVNALALILGHYWLKLPFDYLIGLVSGIQTQAACVSYADELTRSESPSVAYASIYPAAMITKIILAQLLL
ncbi:MAG TPA: aspartate:alanine exchanger family transporter [Terriglobales bacterium]|nr:aspartate:alanine exchanger family transporter [Terriglobales bacterium]